MAARPGLGWLCLLILFQCRVLLALEVSPGSTCAALCLNNPESDPQNPASSWTSPSDITCSDDEYSTTSAGIKFKNCLECLRDSREAKNNESDVSWFLYNLRYSVNVCLYGFPNVTKSISSPCDINYACQPLKTSLRAGNLVPDNGTQLDYCDADGGKFMGPKLGSCLQCLQAIIIALKAGCAQRPKSGALLGLGGSLFASTPISITTPPVNETDLKNDPSPTGMTTGAVVGIAVGAALLFLGGSLLFYVYYRKQKKLYGDDQSSECDNLPRGGVSVGRQTPMMMGGGGGPGSGYSAFDLKRYSASNYELRTHSQQTGYAKNAEYYDEIEKEMQAARYQPNYNFDPNHPMRGPNGALPTHPAYVPRALSRAGTSRDSTPEPPRMTTQQAQHQQQPDAYAANPYLNAAPAHAQAPSLSIPASTHQAHQHRRSASIPPPPPGPPPSQQQQYQQPQQQQYQHPQQQYQQQQQQPQPQQPTQASQKSILTGAPPPPPPPRAPRLALPSMRKLRVPKKYAPPQITVEEPTPVSSPSSNEVPIGLEISNPLPHHLQRFADDQHPGASERERERGGGASSSASSWHQRPTTTFNFSMPADRGGEIRQQHAVDRRRRNNSSDAEYIEIHTSKSDIYG
ncbi:hypothetical protein PG995_006219 [Apiospora arundinis]